MDGRRLILCLHNVAIVLPTALESIVTEVLLSPGPEQRSLYQQVIFECAPNNTALQIRWTAPHDATHLYGAPRPLLLPPRLPPVYPDMTPVLG